MRSSFSERRRQSINAKMNSAHKSDHFSEVSQQGSREQSAGKESQDDQLGWQYFHDSKEAISNLIKELLPKYSQYRRILYDSLEEICQQANLQYDYSALKDPPQPQTNNHLQSQLQATALEEKMSTVEKIISQRRIKKYYKTKHQINFQDQLDPEDDQQEIYRFYQEAFFNNTDRIKEENKNEKSHHEAYNEQFLSPVKRQSNLQQSKASQLDNKILDLSNPYQLDESFQRMKFQNQQNNKRINYTKVNDPFVGFQHQLSFDVKNQQFFVKSANRYQMDSFGLNDDDRNEVNSQIGYDNEKMKRFNKVGKGLEKSSDQLSHADNIYKNFIERQNEELNKQKIRVEELTQKALKVLNNDLDYDQTPKNQEQILEEDKIAQMRYLLGQMMQVFSVQECLKFNLKFKSFELLNKLYENASTYYNQEIVFEQPLEVKYMSQIVKAALPQEDQDSIRVIIHNMFGLQPSIAYQDFLERLTPSINDKEFQSLQSANFTTSSNKTFDLTVRLFNIQIEMEYFQNQLRYLLEKNPQLIDKFIEETTENDLLMPYLIAEFVCKSKKFPKTKKIKAEIYFRKILGEKLMISQFYRWVQSKSSKVNQDYDKQQQEDKYEYYYHLY